jgi:hypothetical protein
MGKKIGLGTRDLRCFVHVFSIVLFKLFTNGTATHLELIRVTFHSEAARLLGSRVRIPLKAWIFVCCVCRVLSR